MTKPTQAASTTRGDDGEPADRRRTRPRSTTADSVIAEAIDRSMPAVATTNVWPIASTIRMADDVSIDSRLPGAQERRIEQPGRRSPARTRVIGAAQAARLAGSSTAAPPGRSSAGLGSAVAARVRGRPRRCVIWRAPRTDPRTGAAGLGCRGQRGLDVGLRDDLHRCLDIGGQRLPCDGGLHASTPIAPITYGNCATTRVDAAALDRLERVLVAVDADDLDRPGLARVGDRLGTPSPMSSLATKNALEVRVGAS